MRRRCHLTVIVEPDTLSAWTGLAGVFAGGLLTAGVAWLQSYSSGRRDRSSEENRAAEELLTGAESLRVTVSAFVVASKTNPDAIRDWVPAITVLLERVQRADATIARLSKPSLVVAADSLTAKAREFTHSFGGSPDAEAFKSEINAFSNASRNV